MAPHQQGRDACRLHTLLRRCAAGGEANGDTIAIPLGNQAFTGELFVELLEEDNGGASSLQLGAVRIPDFLPGGHDFFGVFDDELPGAFYFMKYQVVP